jgi:hypothetical protein
MANAFIASTPTADGLLLGDPHALRARGPRKFPLPMLQRLSGVSDWLTSRESDALTWSGSRAWQARGPGFESPILHPKSKFKMSRSGTNRAALLLC